MGDPRERLALEQVARALVWKFAGGAKKAQQPVAKDHPGCEGCLSAWDWPQAVRIFESQTAADRSIKRRQELFW